MKYSNTTLRELSAQYGRILRKCALFNAMVLMGVAVAMPVMANTVAGGTIIDETYETSNQTNENKNYGGALTIAHNTDGVTIADDVKFENNTNKAATAGGAVKLLSGAVIGDNVEFNNNTAASPAWGGGALYIRTAEGTETSSSPNVTIGSGVKFTGNDGALFGGAIGLEQGDVVIGRADGAQTVFSGNKAGMGGAIHAWKDSEHGDLTSSLNLTNVSFKDNEAVDRTSTDSRALGYGGALAFTRSGEVTIKDSSFEGNKASVGGAIFAQGQAPYTSDADLAVINIDNTEFNGNQTTKTGMYGGAITAAGNSKFIISNSEFIGNTADYSGAIFTYSVSETKQHKGGILDITNTIFEKNTALGAGAVQAMAEASIKDSTFRDNHATTGGDGAGAVFVGATGKVTINNTLFEKNTADMRGGAISTRSADLANNKDARLDIINSTFTGNKAGTTGGAFDNYLYSSVADETAVYIKGSTFTENTAANGGAVYNHGVADKGGNVASLKIENAIFTDNIATTAGGAIYNETNGGISLVGTNVFSGNTANGVANDIYNDGTLTNNGTATLSSGLVNAGTFTNNSGASLTLGGVVELQSALENYGTLTFEKGSSLKVALMDSSAPRSIITGPGTVSGDTSLIIENGSTGGSIKIGNGTTNLQLTDNTLYDIVNESGTITVTKKSAEEAAAALTDAGMTGNQTTAVLAMTEAGSTGNDQADALLNQITSAAQNGDTETAGSLVNELQPLDVPMVQAVATNNAVLSAVTTRLANIGSAGAVVGRSGGDGRVSKLSPWVEGLYSKTHNSQGAGFDAYSQGFAFGADTDLNEDWTVGIGYAYTATDIKNAVRKTNVYGDNYFAYAQYKPSNWYVNAVLNYGHANYKEQGMMNHKYNVDTYGAQVLTGYEWNILNNYAGVRYTYIDTEKYNNGVTETDTKHAQVATAVIGTKVSKDFTVGKNVVFKPEFRLAGTYDFKSDNSTANVSIVGTPVTYSVNAKRLSRAAVETGVGLTATVRNLELSLNYDASFRSENNTQAGMFKIKYNF